MDIGGYANDFPFEYIQIIENKNIPKKTIEVASIIQISLQNMNDEKIT